MARCIVPICIGGFKLSVRISGIDIEALTPASLRLRPPSGFRLCDAKALRVIRYISQTGRHARGPLGVMSAGTRTVSFDG